MPCFWYSSGVMACNYFRFQVCARDGIEIKVTKGHAMLLKLMTRGEDRADKILDQGLIVLTQSCSGHGEFSLSKWLLYYSDTMKYSLKGIFKNVYFRDTSPYEKQSS